MCENIEEIVVSNQDNDNRNNQSSDPGSMLSLGGDESPSLVKKMNTIPIVIATQNLCQS